MPTEVPSSAATSRASRPSIPVMENARHSVSETSARTRSAAQSKRRRRYSRSNSAAGSSGSSSNSRTTAVSPVPRTCRSRAASALIVRFRAIRNSQARNAPRRVGVEPVDRRGDRAEDVLGQVDRVGVLEPAPPRQPVDQGRVDIDELRPCALVPRVAQAYQQTGSRARGLVHPSSSMRIHNPRRAFLTKSAGRCNGWMALRPSHSRHVRSSRNRSLNPTPSGSRYPSSSEVWRRARRLDSRPGSCRPCRRGSGSPTPYRPRADWPIHRR